MCLVLSLLTGLQSRKERRRAKATILRPRTIRPSSSASSQTDDGRRKDPKGKKKPQGGVSGRAPGGHAASKGKGTKDLGWAARLDSGIMDHFKASNIGKKSGGRLTVSPFQVSVLFHVVCADQCVLKSGPPPAESTSQSWGFQQRSHIRPSHGQRKTQTYWQ